MGAKKVLFLDDRSKRFKAAIEKYPAPEYDLTIVCTVAETVSLIIEEEWQIISLDHDLNFKAFVDSDRKDCGMEVVRFIEDIMNGTGLAGQHFGKIVNKNFHFSRFIIHSKNPRASLEMKERLEKCGFSPIQELLYD